MLLLCRSKIVQVEDLCIEEGKLAWKIHLDVVCVDDDGNVHDAAHLAALAALQKLELPATVDLDGVVYRTTEKGK